VLLPYLSSKGSYLQSGANADWLLDSGSLGFYSILNTGPDFYYLQIMESLTVQDNEHQARAVALSSVLSVVHSDISQGVRQESTHVTSIGNIPADILYTIAQYSNSPRDLVFICKRWRDIVLFAPPLWTNVHILFPKAPPLPGDPSPERIARAALRRAGPTTRLSLHLEIHELARNHHSTTTVIDMVNLRGYQFIRQLTLDGGWFPPTFEVPQESISSLFTSLIGEWNSLLHLHLGVLPPHARGLGTVLLSFLHSVISTAPALQHINISSDILPLIEKELSRKRSLINLDITRSFLSYESLRFPMWPNIKSLKICTTSGYHTHIANPLDLRAINPPSSAAGDVSAFPSLTHAVFINHTLKFHSSLRLESLTDLVLSCVDVKAVAPHSVEMPLLRSLVAEIARGIDCIVAPRLETLSIGPLPELVDVTEYLSNLFAGDPQQLDPVHLDLRPLYKVHDLNLIDTTVPLASVYLLRRVERISIVRLAAVRATDRWKYRMLESVNIDDGTATRAMVMLPKWKEMDLGEGDVPDWLWNIIIARQVAGFPVQLNQG